MNKLFPVGAGLMLAGLVLVAGAGGQDKSDADARKALEARVFRLELCDPEEVKVVLEQLLEQPTPLPLGGVQVPSGAPLLPVDGEATWRLAVDPDAAAVIVRGRPVDLALAAEIVAALDQTADKPLPKGRLARAVHLKHADAQRIAAILRDVEANVRVVALIEAKMIVAVGSEKALEEFSNLVRALDVPARNIDEKKLRRLGPTVGPALEAV